MSEWVAFMGGVAATTCGAVIGALLTHKLGVGKARNEQLYQCYSRYVRLLSQEVTLQQMLKKLHAESDAVREHDNEESRKRLDELFDKSIDVLSQASDLANERVDISHRLAVLDHGSAEQKRLEANFWEANTTDMDQFKKATGDAEDILLSVAARLRGSDWWDQL